MQQLADMVLRDGLALQYINLGMDVKQWPKQDAAKMACLHPFLLLTRKQWAQLQLAQVTPGAVLFREGFCLIHQVIHRPTHHSPTGRVCTGQHRGSAQRVHTDGHRRTGPPGDPVARIAGLPVTARRTPGRCVPGPSAGLAQSPAVSLIQ